MPLLNKEKILERGWGEEIFESLTSNKGQVVKSGENFWHLNSIEKMENSEKFKSFNLVSDNQTKESEIITHKSPTKPVIKSALLTREQILERGWTKEAIEEFIANSFVKTKKGNLWQTANIEKMEKNIDFILFNNREEFKEFNNLTEVGKNLMQSLEIDFSKGNHLMAKLDNYNQSKSIFHLVKEDFVPDENGSYSLFTDGSFKTVDKKAFASCGGWIVDDKTKEVIIEFSKPVPLNENHKRSQPNFELIGIDEGVKIIKQLGLKNVQIYTDSLDDARKLFLASYDYKGVHYRENANIYDPIFNYIKNSNSSIAWLPREYNHHADELSEISLNAWEKQNQGDYRHKDYIAENGYKVDRETQIYFHQEKADFKEHNDLENRFTLVITNKTEGKKKYMISLINDSETHRLSVLESIPRDFSYIDESLPEEIKRVKKLKQESIIIMHLARAIKTSKELGDINICVSPLVIAVNNKATPIPSDLQEEFFEFHKALNDYPGNITMTTKWKKLDEKIKGYLQVVEEKQMDVETVIKKVKPR